MPNFIIASHGWSGSTWLANALNLHPDIGVAHNSLDLRASKAAHEPEYKKRSLKRLDMSISANYRTVSEIYTEPNIGTVHLYRLRDFTTIFDKYGKWTESYDLYNLVRNPIALVFSGYGKFQTLFKNDLPELHWNTGKLLEDTEAIYEITGRNDILVGEIENLAFICACKTLGSLLADLLALGTIDSIPNLNYKGVVLMEEVTQDPDAMKRLVNNITGRSDAATSDFLDNVYALGKINERDKSIEKKLPVEERYKKLESWQKDILNFYLDKYDILSAYEKYGYDLSFLRRA